MTDTRHTIRDELVQTLLLRLEKDLSDLRNLSNIRVRFIPRQALVETISQEQVVQLLRQEADSETHCPLSDVASCISPQPGGCHCQRAECTGVRMILAILLLIGRERLVTALFCPAGPRICDQDLISGNVFDSKLWATQSEHEESDPGPEPGSPTRKRLSSANVKHDLIRPLSPSERQSFIYWRWQVVSPYLTSLGSDKTGDEVPNELSLPWQDVERANGPMEGVFSYVQKVKIFPGNHNLVSFLSSTNRFSHLVATGSLPLQSENVNDVFALKTFDETTPQTLTENRFKRELNANRNAPRHSRIVPILAAFKHRRRCHLLLPWAHGGSLVDVWRNYSPSHVVGTPENGSKTTTWCSESWLFGECMGIADALAATHGLNNDAQPGSGCQIHADVKAENVLCFFASEGDDRPPTLKLADFGEAIRVDEGAGVQVKAGMVAHTKTYRPPEHAQLEMIGNGFLGFNYDIWCLGCLYLDFITWFLDGWKGVRSFSVTREEEGDDDSIADAEGCVFEDTFFKRVKRARIPSIRLGCDSKPKTKSGRHITRLSLWMASSVEIDQIVKESVLIVSLLLFYCDRNKYPTLANKQLSI